MSCLEFGSHFYLGSCFLLEDIRSQRFAGLRVATKKDSYEICFVPGNDYASFLKAYRPVGDTSGEFVDTAGNVLGRHSGFEQFTVGQRKGLGIAFGEPRFVVRIDASRHQVVLGNLKELEVANIKVQQLNWLVDPDGQDFQCQVKVRYRQPAVRCLVRAVCEGTAEVVFDSPLTGVAPGQAAVFYGEHGRVLGGGWIA